MRLRNLNALLPAFVVAIILSGCSGEPRITVKKTLAFQRNQAWRIDTHGALSSVYDFTYYQPKGSEQVYFLDPVNHGFCILNAANGSFRQAFTLPDPGPELEGFTVDEQQRTIRLFYVDSVISYSFAGKRKGLFTYHIPDSKGYAYVSSRSFSPIIRNGKLYLSYFANVEGAFRKPAYFKAPVEAVIDLKTKELHLLEQGYPANYQLYCYGYNYDAERLEIDPTTHGYTFPHSDSIYLRNLQTGELTVRFFGALTPKQFKHLPYDQIGSLNESVFDELVQSNPHYWTTTSAPLAGYYFRHLLSHSSQQPGVLNQRFVLFDKDFNYIGESPERPNFVIDSKKGLLSMRLEGTVLILDRLAW